MSKILFPSVAETAKSPGNTGKLNFEPEKTAVVGSRFVSFHYLAMRCETLREVGSGAIMIRDDNGILQPTDTRKIPTDRMPEFLQVIAQGRVYSYWGQHVAEHDSVPARWFMRGRYVRARRTGAVAHRRAKLGLRGKVRKAMRAGCVPVVRQQGDGG